MRPAIAVLILAGFVAACGAPSAPRPEAPRVEPVPSPLPLVEPGRGELDAAADRLARRHRVPVEVLASFGLALDGGRALLVAYAYDGFEAWRAFRGLERWEREAAEWSADPEYEVWMSGLEAGGPGEAAQQAADELFAQCAAGAPGCDEGSVWALAREQAGYAGCGADRVALARLSLRPGAEPELRAATVLEGRRCAPATLAFPADLDGDGAAELVAETGWTDEAAQEQPGDRMNHLALVVADLELATQLSRRLFDRDARPAPGAPLPDARYWPEDVDGDGRAELVIERFLLPGPCALGPCSRLALPAAGLAALRGPPPCFPRGAEPPSPGCRGSQVERTVLAFDRERGLWL